MADKPDKAELQSLGFLFPDELEIAEPVAIPFTTDEAMSEETEASLIELGRQATDGEFNPDDRSTRPDFSPERQEKDSDKRLSWQLDFAAVTKRWGTAMRNGLDPAAHESILAGAKHLAALSVQADMDGALKELRLDADTSDLRKFRQSYKASLVKNTLAEFRLRLEKYVTVSQFESAIWDERNRTLKGNISIAEFVDARLQQFVALRKAVDAATAPAAVEEGGAGKASKRNRQHKNPALPGFRTAVHGMVELGYPQEKLCEELTTRGFEPSVIAPKAKWAAARTFAEAWKNRRYRGGLKKFLSTTAKPKPKPDPG
jgi:hypothetical protein